MDATVTLIPTITQLMGTAGIYAPLALGALGSVLGCTRAGQAACGAMLETESGHGRFVGVAAMPASQTIYGIVIMLALNRAVTSANAGALLALGLLAGMIQMASAIYQGSCAASAIDAAKHKPDILGLAVAPAAIVEGFSVFGFAFALLLGADIPR
jgi:V/A-type H+-transporting ATPase subunit K